MTDAKTLELEEFVEKMESYRGRHTELVTVLIPAEYNVNSVVRQLEGEKSTASNIKSRTTRNNVIEALEKIIRELKLGPQKYLKGIAIYCGNISLNEGQPDIQYFSIEPPQELKVRIYRCDQTFVIDPLKEMTQTTEIYGLLVIERKEATIGILEGTQIKVLQKMTSGVPGKIRAGGQCLSPETLVKNENGELIEIKDIRKRDKIRAVDFKANNVILTNVINKWENTKEEYVEILTQDKNLIKASLDHKFFLRKQGKTYETYASELKSGDILINNRLKYVRILNIRHKKEKINMIDIETEALNFFANNILVHNSSQRFHRVTEGLAKEFFRRVAEAMKDAFFDMPKLKGILIGGPIPTKEEFIEEGQLVTALRSKIIGVKDIGYADEHGLQLLVEASKDVLAEQEITKEKKILETFFNTLGKSRDKATYGEEKVKKALELGAVQILIISEKIPRVKSKEFIKIADEMGTEIHIVSTKTGEGEQFFNLSGIGAILRYAANLE